MERPVGVDNPTRYLAGKLVRIRRDGRRLPINLLSKAGIGSFGSGKVKSNNSVSIKYGGKVLTSSTEYDWSIKV